MHRDHRLRERRARVGMQLRVGLQRRVHRAHDKVGDGFAAEVTAIDRIVELDVFRETLGPDRPVPRL